MTMFAFGRPSFGMGELTHGKGVLYPVYGQRVIFDTDMDSDCDDIAALALLMQLQRLKECTLIAATVASNNDYAAPCTKAMLRAAGLGIVPVGAYQGSSIGGGNASAFAQAVVNSFGSPTDETRAVYDPPVTVLRRALARSPDGSVKIIVAGTCTNVAALLASPADGISTMTGAEMVAAKVASIHVMGGAFASSTTPENNVLFDIDAANAVAQGPVPVIWAGYEVGNTVNTIVTNVGSGSNPFRYGWELYNPANDLRPSWDLMAVLEAVRGDAGVFAYSAVGNVTFANPSSYTTFSASAGGKNRYLTKAVADYLIALLCNGLIADFMRWLGATGGVQDQALTEWTMEEGSGAFTRDRSGLGRRLRLDFTAGQQPVWADLGGGKYALDFTPTQVASPGVQLAATDVADVIFAALVNFDTASGIQQLLTRVGGGQQRYQLRNNVGVLQFVGFTSGSVATTLSFGSLTAGSWKRVIARVSGTSVTCFINGIQSGAVGALAGPQGPVSTDGAGPFVGARTPSANSYIEGLDGKLAYLGFYPATVDPALVDGRIISIAASKGISF